MPRALRKSLLSSRKAQGLSLNTVIIAIIVLIVLVVLVMIFTGYFGRVFTPTVSNCATQGGKCNAQCNTETVGSEISNAKGCPSSEKCCAIVPSIARVAATTQTGGTEATPTTQTGNTVVPPPPPPPQVIPKKS